MTLEEFSRAQEMKQVQTGVFEGNDPNVVQAQIQGYVKHTAAKGHLNQN